MRIAIASGKGGTGKTSLAISLALTYPGEITLLDCDVEEPNTHIFFPSIQLNETSVGIPVPRVDLNKCNLCGKCQEICAYNAIIVTKEKVLIFEELCKGCGGCSLLCPMDALREEKREVGVIFEGERRGLKLIGGRLNIGEIATTFVIREVKKRGTNDKTVIIDSPPGASCPLFESVRDADFVILIAEPTSFGLFDLQIASGVINKLGIPFGIVVNKYGIGDRRIEEFAEREGIPIIERIPFSKEIAIAYSRGIPPIKIDGYKEKIEKIWGRLLEFKYD